MNKTFKCAVWALITALFGTALLACVVKIPQKPTPPGAMELQDTYGAQIRTVKMDESTTCYIVTRDGQNAISCLQNTRSGS